MVPDARTSCEKLATSIGWRQAVNSLSPLDRCLARKLGHVWITLRIVLVVEINWLDLDLESLKSWLPLFLIFLDEKIPVDVT